MVPSKSRQMATWAAWRASRSAWAAIAPSAVTAALRPSPPGGRRAGRGGRLVPVASLALVSLTATAGSRPALASTNAATWSGQGSSQLRSTHELALGRAAWRSPARASSSVAHRRPPPGGVVGPGQPGGRDQGEPPGEGVRVAGQLLQQPQAAARVEGDQRAEHVHAQLVGRSPSCRAGPSRPAPAPGRWRPGRPGRGRAGSRRPAAPPGCRCSRAGRPARRPRPGWRRGGPAASRRRWRAGRRPGRRRTAGWS